VERLPRSLPRVVIPVLLVVAVVGYLLGIHRAAAPPKPSGAQPRIASKASLLLEYPPNWQTATAAPTLPGFSIAAPLLLAPAGKAATAGLLGGQLPSGGPSPLPASFLALLHVVPRVEVLNLTHVQAYRFSGLNGYERTLDVYVIPTAGGGPTTLVCYAPSGSASVLGECEQIVATVTVVGQASYPLTPNATYAGQLSGLIETLNSERATLRRQLSASTAPGTQSAIATRLADRFASVAASLAAITAPQAANAAQVALANALVQAHAAYAGLAAAAATGEVAGYNEAERQVSAAEASVNTALENFALLGYNHS
jgi:hypothetical protein